MKNPFLKCLAAGLILSLVFSCERDEGFGGNSSISGTIKIKEYNNDMSLLLYEYAARDFNVYLVFGDNTTIGDDVETSYTGDFRFNYLTPGDYELFYYSDDTSASSGHG